MRRTFIRAWTEWRLMYVLPWPEGIYSIHLSFLTRAQARRYLNDKKLTGFRVVKVRCFPRNRSR